MQSSTHQPLDIIVTTPMSARVSARVEAEEVRECIANGGEAWYFRNMGRNTPKHVHPGCRVFYVEDGYIRGFAKIAFITSAPEMVCSTTGRRFGDGIYVAMDARSWKWIEPIAMRGFQGWRYSKLREEEILIVGGWLDPMPYEEEAEMSREDFAIAVRQWRQERGIKEIEAHDL